MVRIGDNGRPGWYSDGGISNGCSLSRCFLAFVIASNSLVQFLRMEHGNNPCVRGKAVLLYELNRSDNRLLTIWCLLPQNRPRCADG